MISKSIMELVNRDASLKVKVIITHVAEKYKYIISCKKAWIAKCKVDGTWLYGKYRGTMLMAVAQDGNENIFSIAFALVEKFQYPPSSHVYCIIRIAQNFMREIKDKDLRKIVVNMGYALTEAKFNYYRGEIGRTNNDALSWIDNIPREKWARAFNGGQHWGHMTTNLVEEMNSVLKETRNHPITILVKSTYYRLTSLFDRRGHQWTKMLASGQVSTDKCNKGMVEEVMRANMHNVMQFGRERFYFMVQEKINHNNGQPTGTFSVDLRKQHCDCGKFQAFHLPCSHVIVTCLSIRQDYSIHILDVFKILNVFKVYKESFLGLLHEENWPQYEGFILCHDDSMRRRKKGRPNSTTIRTEMNDVEKEKRRCGICREIGHMRRKCPNVAGPSQRPSR
ncbi:uncharacterized protein LOC127103845 [Lathyrus oleraceus]|uniref:uncharacterized protein LOC127103845 n=1 Tax=Pisum sativum TaxID=3888 RepID=UPI0021CEAC16|nr:uncharacterized protein LOC127103845 [Pisum sativum]